MKRPILTSTTTQTMTLLIVFILLATFPTQMSSEPVNVALNRPVTAFYTCGLFGAEPYNTLYDRSKSYEDRVNAECKAFTPPEAASHGALEMVDGKMATWWQSVSRKSIYENGTELMPERNRLLETLIRVDLQQEFLAEKIILRLGDALSPRKIAIRKSLDGKRYTPWVFAVTTLSFCRNFFDTDFKNIPGSDTDKVCLGYKADAKAPGDNIELDISQVPDVLKEWTRIRHLEIKFYDMWFTYNQFANRFNHYAVRELIVMAECPCHGQATDCLPSPVTGQYECVCGGNTKGMFCDSCEALYNQYQFQQGKPCEECNCFNHATICFYQPKAEQNKESIDKDGNRKGGGVCLDCKDNTGGNNCDKCVGMHYRPVGVAQTDEKACVPCECSVAGSDINPDTGVADCVMNDDETRTDSKVPGECFCKANVEGLKCDKCKQGFYKLDESNDEGCTDCACFVDGTVGGNKVCVGDATGQCPCKANVQGRACNECKDGFYALSGDNSDGCVSCACDAGGAVDQKCDKVTGQCTCRSATIKGRTCNSVESIFYYPDEHAIKFEFEESFGLDIQKNDKQYSGFSGKGYAAPDPKDELSGLLNIPANSQLSEDFILVIVYQTPAGEAADSAITVTAGNTTTAPLSLPVCAGKWCLVNTGQDKLIPLFTGPHLVTVTISSGQVLLDKIVAVPVEYTKPETVLATPLPAGCDFLQNTMPQDPADADACKQALFSITMRYWGSALPCNCDQTGSVSLVCDVHGGQCLCHTGVIGRQCDTCAADHFSFSSSGCKPCDCDSLGSSCDPVSGQCECPENTFGRQCEWCLPGSWGWQQTQGCKDCNCHADGAVFAQCNGTTGVCTCKPGVKGDKCDECEDGFYNLGSLGCTPCSCDKGGAANAVCNKTSGQCDCKSNTEGRQCNQCLPGTFGLGEGNPDGCLDCICMGVTTKCASSQMKFSSVPFALSSTSADGSTPNLSLATADGKASSTQIEVATGDNGLTSTLQFSYESAQPVVYWKMPKILVSNLMNLYGSVITVSLSYVNVDGQALSSLKALMLTSNGKKLNTDFGPVNEGLKNQVSISLRENTWKLDGTSVALSRKEFLKLLSRGSEVLIPATFSSGKHTSRLSRLEFNIQSDAGITNPSVEVCECGSSYSGNSCENCAESFKRSDANLTEYFGICVTCDCNGHSSSCDEDTSECLNCQHNTMGKSCQQCAVGFYGNATIGTSGDCLPCPCFQPRVVDGSCHEEDGDGKKTVKCDSCRDGYVGDLCHTCDAAYYGNPEVSGGTCTRCECNGNANSCDSVTGVCEDCTSNTAGDKCEKCAENFYGNASAQNCQACGCQAVTSSSTVCDSSSGQCTCVSGVGGRTCEKCLDDYWGFTVNDFVGCKPCGCNAAGSVSTQCAGDTGKCTCKPNTEGDLCDSCSPNFFGLPEAACQACDCNTDGTVPGTICNANTGQCSCQPGVGNRKCDQCLPLFVDLTSNGCTECDLCQKALGNSVKELTTNVLSFVTMAKTVHGVQDEDDRLQVLSTQLDDSLKQVGLSGSEATTVSDILDNITSTMNTLTTSFTTTDTQVKTLSTAAADLSTKSTGEAAEQLSMLTDSSNIIDSLTGFERSLTSNMQTLVQYSNTASKLAEQGKGAGTINVDLSSETSMANALLAEVEDIGHITTVIEKIKSQQTLTLTQMTALQDLKERFDTASISVNDLITELHSVIFNVELTEKSLDDALNLKSQAEELLNAVQTILTNTEKGNTALASVLSNVRTAVANTNAIYNGNAQPLIQGADAPTFPAGVSNYESAASRLNNILTSLQLLINQVSTSVAGSESHLADLDKNYQALNATFQSLPTIGKEANTAIKNYDLVIEDLDSSVKMANTASNIITQVQSDLSGDALATRQTSYNEEKQRSEAMRDEFVQLDYKPQVLENKITSQQTQLQQESEDWKVADGKVEEMNTAAQALGGKFADNSFIKDITAAETKVKEAASKSQNVADSVDSQIKVLDQKETELETTKSQIQQVKTLDVQVRTDLNNHLEAFSSLQTKLDDATKAKDSGLASTATISEKISLLETKLANAEKLLERLRQPRTFDGSLSLQINNPKANTASTSNSLSLTVRKAAGFTDGNIFFTENQNNDGEFEVGIQSNKVFFEFNAGDKVTITNPTEICDDCWAKVVASRLGNVGYLSVTKLPSGEVLSSSGSSQPENMATPLTLNSPLYVGSLPQDTNIIKVTNKQFQGCLSDINFHSQAINLWSAAVSSNQEAKCCDSPPTSASTLISDAVSFSGFGFLVRDYKGTVLNDVDSFSFEFRTLSSSGTIVYVTSEDSQTLLSIGLSSGSVVLRTKSNADDVSIQTDKVYNTGKWTKVIMEKTATQRQLSVSFLEDLANAEVKSGAIVDISLLEGRFLIMGASSNPFTAGTTTQQASSTLLSKVDDSYFSGCLRKTEVKVTSASEVESLNLKEDIIIQEGVTHDGCLQNVVTGLRFLSDSAYVLLPSATDVSQFSSIEMKFATTEDHGVLLYATAVGTTRYLYVGLFGGYINVKYNQENPGTVVSKGVYVSDGQEHTLKIDVVTQRVSIKIDGIVFEESSQTLTSAFLSFSNVKLYLGGSPDDTLSSSTFPSIKSFVGGMMSFTLNENTIDWKQSSFEASKDVSLSGLSPPKTSLVNSDNCAVKTTPQLLPLELGISLESSEAISWSDHTESGAQLVEYFLNSFTLELDFSSYKADGVFLYVANALVDQTEYFILYMENGEIFIKMKSSSGTERIAKSKQKYNNGQRYQLTAVRVNDFVTLRVGVDDFTNTGAPENTVTTLTIPPSVQVFVGGNGVYDRTKSPLPENLKSVESNLRFAGALFSLKMKVDQNEKTLIFRSLDRTKYPAVPQSVTYGVSLDGTTSYLGLGPIQTGGENTIDLKISTTTQSALLFALYQDSKYFVIDFDKNQIRLHLSASFPGLTGSLALTIFTFDKPSVLCDGKPHNLKFLFQANKVTATVDGKTMEWTIPASHGVQIFTSSSSFFAIGGLPDNAPVFTGVSTTKMQGCVENVKLAVGSDETVYDPTRLASTSKGLGYGCPV